MTLKHKNTSQWAKRILKRGLSVQDEGTRAAIAAQLQQNTLLTRKMNSMKDDSSSEESSDDDDDESDSEAKILNRGKEKILKALEEDNEIPNSGVFSLPFMVHFHFTCCLCICLQKVYLLALLQFCHHHNHISLLIYRSVL
jgi:U3 small nucleolar RNA-associated protein 14